VRRWVHLDLGELARLGEGVLQDHLVVRGALVVVVGDGDEERRVDLRDIAYRELERLGRLAEAVEATADEARESLDAMFDDLRELPTPDAIRATVRPFADALTLQEATYPPVYYLPLDDVDQSLLRRTEHATYCPYKGNAAYYSVVTADGELTNVIWTYETPYPAVESIAKRVAFYTDRVELTVD
jgi:uncharacterized protein (DUF427 family)